MDEIPFYRKPWFNSILLTILLFGLYIYKLVWGGGFLSNFLGIVLDFVLIILLYQVCIFFYAQFLLPIHTLKDRQKIVNRLWLHAMNAHGPAIFVKNGRKVERLGESEKRGPGVLWIDTASAVVTRTFTTFKQVMGPGVHFIEANEKIASIIGLHTQTQAIGPIGGDDPFIKLMENPTEEEQNKYKELLTRCMVVRALTRDGIEVFPRINVTFKIDAKPADSGKNGSHFGFNPDAVEKAARSEGISSAPTSEGNRRVDWNQLPALITAELWREYLSKFTFNELFDPTFPAIPDISQPEIPPAYVNLPKTPLLIKRGFAARLLRTINNSFEKRLEKLIPKEEQPEEKEILSEKTNKRNDETLKKLTALQIINQMMKTRLTQAVTAKLDDCGRILEGYETSSEFRKLQERGIAVINVSINWLHFSPIVESRFLKNWNTNWLAHAIQDQNRIERLNNALIEKGRQQALLDHAVAISQAIVETNPISIQAALMTLLRKTQNEITTNERLLNRMRSDIEILNDLAKWNEIKDL